MKRLRSSAWIGLVGVCVGVAAAVGACAAGNNPPPAGTNNNGNGGGGTGGAGTAGAGGDGQGGVDLTSSASSGAGGEGGCNPGSPDKDNDGDGFTENQGDCNDCNKFVNPKAVEVIAEPDEDGGVPVPSDEDCSGKADDLPPACDDGLALASLEPTDAAKALGLCKFVKTAKWVLADGTPPPVDATKLANFHLGHGILKSFGPNKPQEGSSMLVLSSGTAREKTDAQSVYRNFDKGYSSNAPFGFPKASPACPNVVTGKPFDATGLQLEIEVPSNALSLSFDFQFFSYEWPDNICKPYNDFFNAIVEPFPMGQSDGNIAFDAKGNAISVNSGFFDACGCPGNPPGTCKVPPGSPNPVATFACGLGKTALVGTPFEKDEANFNWTHGSTGWLRTTTPVTPGTNFRIRFVTYDSTDGKVDSTTLIDNWRWSGKPGTTETEIIVPK